MSSREIVGIVLVRNEDRFLARALANTAAFCDRFLLFDHGSTDSTGEILEAFAARHPGAVLRRIGHPCESHEALQPFAGRDCWVFGIDGDEVYDPMCLEALRPKLLGGEFDREWMVMGHCLHVEHIDFEGGAARGFPTPPARSITKLFNFAAIDAWPGPATERLHGGKPVFRSGFDPSHKRLLFEESGWDDSPLRCLHFAFCPRSSTEAPGGTPRRNIDEIYNRPPLLSRLIQHFTKAPASSAWKNERYRRGEPVTVSTKPFFP